MYRLQGFCIATHSVFAVIRIITAIFLKETLENAGSDSDLMIAAAVKKKQAYIAKLGDAFLAIDEDRLSTMIVCLPGCYRGSQYVLLTTMRLRREDLRYTTIS